MDIQGEEKCVRWGRKAAKFVVVGSVIVTMAGAAVLAAGVSLAHAADNTAKAAVQQAQSYRFQFRIGRTDIVPEFIAAMEQATQDHPESADLWYALGDAYLARAAVALTPEGKVTDAPEAIRKGFAALNQALKIDPNHADSLARRGAMMALLGTVLPKQPQMSPAGVADMNKAVELAPKSIRVRLQRAFVGPTLPDGLRDREAEAADYDFIIPLTNGSRQGDYIRLLRGDLAFESGDLAEARLQYEAVAASSTPAAAEGKERLQALDAGGVSKETIAKLRTSAGAQCSMCHGT